MRCVRPLKAWKQPSGAVVFRSPVFGSQALELPCGQCIECRLDRSRQWAIRCMHEAQMHESSWFVTLTYSDENLPDGWNLNPRDLQLFLKRVRKKFGPVRFFACGEYGDVAGKPHYHLCMFGLRLDDLKFYKGDGEARLYNSESLGSCWKFGYVVIGNLTFDSAAYVARYVCKKVTGKQAAADNVDAAAREYVMPDGVPSPTQNRSSVFGRMSLKPGIGATWFSKFRDDVYNYDHVIMNGRELRPPRYYDKLLAADDLPRLYKHKVAREKRALESSGDNTPARLAAREANTRARLNLKRRSL